MEMPESFKVLWFGVLLGLSAVPGFAQAPHGCADFTGFGMAGVKLQITNAAPVAASMARTGGAALPAYCRVDGVLDPRTGAEGKSYGIGFALALPDAWNGGFLFQGGGGLNGTVGAPLAACGESPRTAL
jgi:hypothetical protein